MLIVQHPPSRPQERAYVARVLLGELLGLEYRLAPAPQAETRLSLAGDSPTRAVVMPDTLLGTPREQWLSEASLPPRPLAAWRVAPPELRSRLLSPTLPVVYGRRIAPGQFLEPGPEQVRLGLDLWGSAFFLLTRYEEITGPQADAHGRYPAQASLAAQEGFLRRPLVQEYAEVLRWTLQQLWPRLSTSAPPFRMRLTHDVDSPLTGGLEPASLLARACLGDLVKRRRPGRIAQRLGRQLAARRGATADDPYDTFDWLMDQAEACGRQSVFHFVAGDRSPRHACRYRLGHPWLRRLLARIGQRGHRIGLHAGYASFGDAAQLRREWEELCTAARRAGMEPDAEGRQHYLRWQAPQSWRDWAETGLACDSTLSFVGRAGFRAGIGCEYPVFDARAGEPLSLREAPLVVMDATLFDPRYEGLAPEEGVALALELLEGCRRLGGEFVLLWHNSYLVEPWQREAYRAILAAG